MEAIVLRRELACGTAPGALFAVLADSDKLPPPGVIAQEIVDDLEAALEQFRLIAADLAGDLAGDLAVSE